MQIALDFGAAGDIAWVRDRLISRFGHADLDRVRTPVGQLVRSSIGGRTRDEISLAAYRRLVDTYPEWSDVACATTASIEAVINDVTFADVKARHLRGALRAIKAYHPDFDLMFLGSWDVAGALAWLERLPGVGRKVSASALNFSTLRMPALVVDTHVLRILRRFGFVGRNAEMRSAYDVTMAMLHDWRAVDLAELHIVMKRLGQTVCRADRACCRHCPISQRCRSAAIGMRHLEAVEKTPEARTGGEVGC